jgi:hypothetical protein
VVAQELEKLARLHESGALTDEEFARAKDAALNQKDGGAVADRRQGASLGSAANRYVTFQIGMSIVGLIVFVVVFVLFFLPRFNSFPQP